MGRKLNSGYRRFATREPREFKGGSFSCDEFGIGWRVDSGQQALQAERTGIQQAESPSREGAQGKTTGAFDSHTIRVKAMDQTDHSINRIPASGQKVCGKCGAVFLCAGAGCWCGSIAVPAETLRELRTRFKDCLCPACLRAFVQEAAPTPEV